MNKVRGRFLVACIALASLLVMAMPARAGSIWAKSGSKARVLYADDTARKIGDSLTILVNERGVIKNSTKRDMDKKSTRSAKVTGKMDMLDAADDATGKLFNLRDLDVKTEAGNSFEGEAKFDSDRSVADSVTVTVVDVQPNGNLVVQGTRTRTVEGDTQIVQVSGIVRVSDISFTNTVHSEKIADFHVVYKASGQEKQFTNPGWLDKFLNLVNPF